MLQVDGGEPREFKRVDGSNALWEVHAEPDSDADVTLTLPETTDCAAADAVCTASEKPLSRSVSITIPGPEPEPDPTEEPTPTATPQPTDTPESGPATPALTGFTVVNATDQAVLATLSEGGTLTLDDPAGGSYGILVQTSSGSDIGSVRLELSGGKSHTQTENLIPYSLYGDTGDEIHGESLPAGDYTLRATAYSEARLEGDELESMEVSFRVVAATDTPEPEPASLALTGFTVVNATDQAVLATLSEGGTLALDDPDGGSYGIVAQTSAGADIGSVRLELSGQQSHTQTDSLAPYSLYGDTGGEIHGSPCRRRLHAQGDGILRGKPGRRRAGEHGGVVPGGGRH